VLNPTTCAISGTPTKPTCQAQTHTITATNCAGASPPVHITINVVQVAPNMCAVMNLQPGKCLTLNKTASLEILVDEESDPITKNSITLTHSSMDTAETLATVRGLQGFSLTPAEPGFLSGTPQWVMPPTEFTFKVANCGGAVTCKKTICVKPPPPCIYYKAPSQCDCSKPEEFVFTRGLYVNETADINKLAQAGGAKVTWTINATLPKGMFFLNGKIYGTPTELQLVPIPFKVTATNSAAAALLA
jgi:hypothetical protein